MSKLRLKNEFGDIFEVPDNMLKEAKKALRMGRHNVIDDMATGNYDEGGLVSSTPSRAQVIESKIPVMPSDEILLKSATTSSGTLLPVYTDLQQYKACNTGDCAEWATTDAANQYGTSRQNIEPAMAESSWYRKNKMLNAGGELIWEKGMEDNFENMQIGDQVLLMNGRTSSDSRKDPARRDGNVKLPLDRHAGTIIGRGEDGVPIVRHNIWGRTYEEPINNIREKFRYSPSSVVRAAGANKYIDSMKEVALEKAKKEWVRNNYTDDIGFTMVDDKVGKDIYKNYVADRQNIAIALGMDPGELDKVMQNLIGIAAQESNVDNTMPDNIYSKGKQVAANLLPNFANKGVKGIRRVAGPISDALISGVYDVDIDNETPDWRRQILVDKAVKEKGLNEKAALDYVIRKHGYPSNVTPITGKSYGPWKQKAAAEGYKKFLGDATAASKGWDRGWNWRDDKLLRNAVALYNDNYRALKKQYPNESDDFLHNAAIINWSAPSKAKSKKYMDYFVRGVGNPRGGMDSSYLKNVLRYRDKLTKNK